MQADAKDGAVPEGRQFRRKKLLRGPDPPEGRSPRSAEEPRLRIGYDQHGQIRYNVRMRTVNISDLKAQLSAYIHVVKAGEEVLICDRNKPVARIVPCRLNDHSEQEQRLVARGVLTPPLKRRPSAVSWPEPPGNISDDVMEQVWREERQGR
jgi:prevent-host-death family protein